MTSDERILKYIENELSPEEKKEFEKDLNNTTELRKEFEKYLRVNAETDEIKKVKLNSLYLNSVIPDFRKKLETPKSVSTRRNLGYAFGVMLVFILSIVILKNFLNNETEVNDLTEFTQSLNENQRIDLLEEINSELDDYNLISENISSEELSDILTTDMEINSEVAEAYDISYNELIVGLNEQKVDKIYTEILNRKF
jgi:hypothetical protein